MFEKRIVRRSARGLAALVVVTVMVTVFSCSSGSKASRSAAEPVSSEMRMPASGIVPAIAPPGTYMELASASYNEWLYANFASAEKTARQVTDNADATVDARVEAEKTLVLVFLSKGDDNAARKALERMLELDPSARFSPEGKYPPVVYDFYHEVKDAMPEGTMDIKTIAIGDFENNSVYTKPYKNYDFDLFRPALIHSIITDLSASTGLKIVDRQRTEKIIEETQLAGSGMLDPQQAVRAGKLLGAHCFVFGQYMILNKKTVRIDMRVVHTATGEIIVSEQITGEFRGKPEKFLDIEKELVMVVAGAVDQITNRVVGRKSNYQATAATHFIARGEEIKDRENYSEAHFLIGQAVEYEENMDYRAALSSWRQVLEMDPENEDAKQRVLVLTPIVAG